MTLRILAVAVVVLAASSADADVLRATLGQPLREVSHAVDISVKDGVATYRVRRVFANPGDQADEAGLEIHLPFGAAATGLRIRARDRWYDGELMEREAAARLYEKLTGRGRFAPKDPALLQWVWADQLYLQVFPVLPGQTSTVEYTLTVPTRYQSGKIFLSYPRVATPGDDGDEGEAESRPLVPPVITVQPAWGDATSRVVVDGLRVAPGAPIVLTADVDPPWLARLGGSADASYVASKLLVPDGATAQKTFATAKLTLAIDHTYRGDVHVDLLTPKGEPVRVYQGDDDKNDVRRTFELKLPAGTRGAGTWQLIVSDHATADVGTLDSWSLELGTGAATVKAAATDLPLFIPDAPETEADAGVATIELAPPAIDVLAARLGKVVASDKHAFARLELDLAPELRPLPKQARIVFVIDASHSVGPDGIDQQLAIARAYLSHVPDAAVELVLYRRAAMRLFGRFVPARNFEANLDAARKAGALAPGNGSALDEGARVAATALVGQTGPLRVVITTDDLLRTRFTPALATAALAKLPPHAIVHVAVPSPDEDEPAIRRDDRHALAPIATGHHGIFAAIVGLPEKSHKQLAAAVLGLVRPVQLDRVEVTGIADADVPDVLREGSGVRAMQSLPRAPDTVTITGLLWSDPYRRVVRVDPTFARATAGWVFSEDEHQALSEAEQMTIARFGRAVSPVTSYLAIEPGVRPSTAGIVRSSYGVGSGRGGMRGRSAAVAGVRVPPDLKALVAGAAAKCVASVPLPAGWRVDLDVETTKDEVVDVAITRGEALPVARCLVEAVWAVRLTRAFDRSRERFSLTFR